MIAIDRVTCGGQTGADQGALLGAALACVPTGGWACRGWTTERGPAPWLAGFGLAEHASPEYPARTRANVAEAHGLVYFGRASSPGGRLTTRLADEAGVPWRGVLCLAPVERAVATLDLDAWFPGGVLMVGGNRESSRPGIRDYVCDFMWRLLRTQVAALPRGEATWTGRSSRSRQD